MKVVINGDVVEVGDSGTPVIALMQAEYDALSEDQKQADILYVITDGKPSGDSPSGGGSWEIYSTEEVLIGTYMDKPLYRKVFEYLNPAAGQSWNVIGPGPDFCDTMVSMAWSYPTVDNLRIYNGYYGYQIAFNELTNQFVGYGPDVSNKNQTISITAEYTKTTDEAVRR